MKWNLYNGFKNGTSKLYSRKCFGYQEDQDGNLIILEKDAQTVRRIFELYLDGFSTIAIIRELKRLEIKSPTGKDAWSKRSIETLLSNEKYIGNVLLGKTYSKGYPDNERLINKDEKNKYLATNNHPPIISEEIFERVQAEKLRRSNIQIDNDGVKRKSTHYSMKKR
ncbi:recombinase family protein [Peptoclostridium acidaminophilum]|uniref:recombinase family protein n=1 Tax=Peptoclostridium acidaminophilum TaxID=1731 RepID=UPI002418AC68|nr:recombinase family protein [Peptoclostridium acidaminophilum]